MIDQWDLYNRFTSYANTYQGGFFRPQTDFAQAVKDINMEIWNENVDQAEKTQKIKDNLAPFTKKANIIVSKLQSSGLAVRPDDYARFSSAAIIVTDDSQTIPDENVDGGKCIGDALNEQERQEIVEAYNDSISQRIVEEVDDSRWAACLQHKTKKPTLSSPKIRITDKGFEVAPRNVSVIVLSYYIVPPDPVFVYTLSEGDVQTGAGDMIIYDAKKSTQLLWSATMINEFLIRLGERFGIFTRDQFMVNVSKN